MFRLIPWFFLFYAFAAPTYFAKFLLIKFHVALRRLELAFFSLFLGQIAFASSIFLLSLFFGLSWMTVLIVSTLLMIINLWIFKLQQFSFNINTSMKKYEKYFLIFVICVEIIFIILLQRHMLSVTPNGFFTPHNTFGDLQYHLAIINSFYFGNNFPPQNPIYAGIRLSYPFMIDFYSAVFRTVGFTIQNALIFPSAIFGICFFALFILFGYRFLRSKQGAVISSIIFIFNGGLGGYLMLKESLYSPNFLQNLSISFSSVIDKYNFRFPNGISSVFMAERPIVPGMAAFFAILILLWIGLGKGKSKQELFLAGFIVGILPLWHTHTLVALGLCLPFYFVCYWIYKRLTFVNAVKSFLPLFYFSIPLGLLGMSWHFPQIFSGGVKFFSFKTGWVVGPEGFWIFWIRNLGIFPLLLLLSFFFLDKKQKLFYVPVFLIFIFANFIQFQPFDWDNYKVLLIWYAVSSIIVTKLILKLSAEMQSIGKLFATLILSFLILNGTILIIGDYLTFYGLFTNEDIELSSWEIQNTKPQDLILTGPQHNQFSILSGRKILMGYPGYLWTQGIDTKKRKDDIWEMYHGNMELIKKYNIKFIVLGYEERKFYNPDEKFLDSSFRLVKQTNNFKIYKVL
jgi:hypothetical protein